MNGKGVTASDPRFGLNYDKFGGLNDNARRSAELVGHEFAHGLFALRDPADGTNIQHMIDERDQLLNTLPLKHRYPLAPDVQQRFDNAEAGADRTEKPAFMLFEIQKWDGRRWDTQLIGTDVGSGDTAVSIDAHESKEFLPEIATSGRYRLRLTYQEGDADTKCPLPQEHATTIRLKPFSVQLPVQSQYTEMRTMVHM